MTLGYETAAERFNASVASINCDRRSKPTFAAGFTKVC
jgi:hypothetical protein